MLLWASPKEEQQNCSPWNTAEESTRMYSPQGWFLGVRHPTSSRESTYSFANLWALSDVKVYRIVFWVNFLRVTLNTTKRVNTDVLTQGGFPHGHNGFHISLRFMDYHWGNNGFHISLRLRIIIIGSHLNGFHISLRLWIIIWVALGIRRRILRGRAYFFQE